MGPLGKHSGKGPNTPSLIHNEFIVYDVRQVQMHYLVDVEFDFK